MKPQILYTNDYLTEKFFDIEITDEQRKAQKLWLTLLENKELEAETENYRNFEDIILRDLLNFPEEILRKGKDQKQVEMAYKDPSGNWAALFEAKGHKTTNLFAKQNYGKDSQDSPFIQTYTNMGRFAGITTGICTNYQNFILIDSFNRLEKCHEFDFLTTKNDDAKLKEFIGIFSYDALVLKKIHETLHTESMDKDKKFTTEFYKLFHETRLMVIKAFKEKEDVSQDLAEYYAQIFLDRIVFLFFALDKELILDKNQKPNPKLFAHRILNQLQLDQCTKNSRKIFDDINLLFTALDEGDDTIPIHGFNGTLFSGKIPNKVYFLDFQDKHFFSEEFQNSKLSKPPELSETHQKIFQKFEKVVNPIIRNLLILDSFDFNSQVNVTILGHILEQSIEDLDKLRKSGNTNRKINGVYYTPETITDYICKNTIIPFLSKNNHNTIHELILEYDEEINVLEEKIDKIRIIDPACGSGAFLIKAAEILLKITERIDEVKGAKQTQMNEFFPENEISKIIKNNIFGVDINEKSVEITKLSLFLKMAKINQKLEDISKNIVKGNSLIDDSEIDSLSFDWKDKFPEVIQNGGFDIVIGNPPWQLVQPDVDEFFSPLKEMQLLLAIEFPKKNQLFSKLTIHKKNALMQKCLENSEINVSWEEYLSKYHKQKDYLLNPEKFRYQVPVINGKKPTGIGLNLYKLFVEKSHQILKKNGLIGFVLPSGIYADLGSSALRKLFYENYEILELSGFVNKKPIFEDVHKQFKFCTILLRKGKFTKKFLAKFNEFDDEKLKNFKKTAFTYDLDLVKMSSPDSLSILECKDQVDQRILQKQYQFPLLQQDAWDLEPSREFNMTDDAKFFHTGEVGPPLFQGDMIHMFTDSFSSPKYWIDEAEGVKELKRKELYRIKRASKQKDLKTLPRIHSDEYRLVWRVQTNATNVRTLISTILPPNVFLGNSLNYLDPLNFDGEKYYKPTSSEELIFLCGIFNSFTSDFIIRHKVSSNLNMFYLMELPIPRFDNSNPLHNKIFINSSKLICTTDEFTKLREEVGITEFTTEPDKRLALEAQINACAAKIYDLTRDELEYVLELFPSVDGKLKDLTLDEFSLL
jgi:hypothetical protein